jgi:hypothetical protein
MTTTKTKTAVAKMPVEFTKDGLRAIETATDADGTITSVARDATFDEQVAVLAPQILEQAIGIVHNAIGGTVKTSGDTITIKLEAR